MPNHMTASGMIASVGMARLIWIGSSMRDSPSRLSPAARASTTPPTMNAPPTTWTSVGASPTNIHAKATANSTSSSEMNDATVVPRARAA